MKKVIRLTESELVGLVKKIISEESNPTIKLVDGKVLIINDDKNSYKYELVTKYGKADIAALSLKSDGTAVIKGCIGFVCKSDTLKALDVNNILTLASKGVKKIDIPNKQGVIDKNLVKIT